MRGLIRRSVLVLVVPVMLVDIGGCAKEAPKAEEPKEKPVNKKSVKTEEKGHDHGGWWCEEHGVPEAECSMCNAKVAAERKKAGDWCEKHDRAKSQCFICDASLKEKYAAKYRVKYGKEPPEPTDQKEDPKKK